MGRYLQRIWDCRFFWLSLVRMDLRTRYRGSVLGLGWSLLHPLCMTAILCVVFGRIFGADVPYFGPYVLCGLSCWAFILNSALQGCYCFRLGEMYIRQYPAPIAIYPLRLVLGLGFHLVLALVVVIGLAAVLRGLANPLALLSLVPSIFLLMVLGWAIAVLSGLATVYFPDTKHLTEVAFQGLFYLTPVMLTDEILNKLHLATWFQFNPFFWFMRLLRDPVLLGQVPSWQAYGIATLTTVVGLLVAGLMLRRLERRFIFYL
jgi:lipopolysaccharide transport system permease protein